jgi:hypothetical protein
MENTPTIRIQAIRVQSEYQERIRNWTMEVYYPLMMTVPGMIGVDYYQIVKENPQYLRTLSINYYANRAAMLGVRSDPKARDVLRDTNTTWASRSEMVWWVAYQLIRNFRNEEANSRESAVMNVENAPIMHIEDYALSKDDQEKYETWFKKWGYELYIPLLMKLPGLKEYSWYRLINVESTGLPDYYKTKRAVEYPLYLSILHFENVSAYENYEKSIELAGFREAMKFPFPGGLDFKWYVQYQLVKSWRK